MASVYTTIQGDTWDLMAYKLFGAEKYMKYLCEANWPLLDVMVFEAGVKVNVPDLPEEVDEDLPFWRQDDDANEEPYSAVEEVNNE